MGSENYIVSSRTRPGFELQQRMGGVSQAAGAGPSAMPAADTPREPFCAGHG